MGEIFALAAALFWALAVILFKRTGETVPPFTLNLFRVVVSTTLTTITLICLGDQLWGAAPLSDYMILFASGIIAIAISDTLFHRSLNLVGAGISAIVDCLYSPFTVLLAFLLLSEHLSAVQFVGMGLVLGGVLAAARHRPPPWATKKDLVWGVAWGILAMATLALGIVIAKPVLNHSGVIWATAVRQVGCLGVMLPLAVASPKRREILRVFRPGRVWWMMLPGAVLGSYLSLMCWIAGMKYTLVSVAAIINQSSTVFVLILAALFLDEPFTFRKVIASILAIIGIFMVTFG